MKKKIVNVFAMLLAAGMLVGCGGSDAEKPLKDMKVEKYVTLGEYKGLEVTVAPISVADSDVETLMSSAYTNYVTAETGGIVDRAVAVGDTANIDYVGKKDGVAFEGGTAQGANLTIGSGQFIDGFEDGLVGVMPGETVDLNLTFPKEYHSADLARQAVVFTVTVNYIVPANIAPADMQDSVVATMGIEGVNTVEGFRQYAYEYLYSNAEYNYAATVENEVFNAFLNTCVFEEIPQDIADSYRDKTANAVEQNAAAYGMDAESFVASNYGVEYDTFIDEYCVEAVKQDMALQALANKENLNMSDEEVDATLLERATEAGYSTVEEYLGDGDKETYRNYLMYEKVLDYLKENAIISNE